jgi:hypothetical protein
MGLGLFSTYSTGENRVTASILAVLRSLALSRTERLLGALMEQSEFQLVQFENQVAKGGPGVPDAMIASSVRILIETKLHRNALGKAQVRRHLRKLRASKETTRVLLVLTPDDARPRTLETMRDSQLVWAPFSGLDQAIEGLLADKNEVISEREGFLLRELQSMLLKERLVGSGDAVLVVPARNAWPEYQRFHAYVCQPDRTFKPVKQVAFYADGHIQPSVPAIIKTWEAVKFEDGKHEDWLGELVTTMLADGSRHEGVSYKVLRLSGPDDPKTLRLSKPVENDLRSAEGRPIAFTQNQRYVSLDKLKKAQYTSELVKE